MALRIWLPLLGSFENKGCGDIALFDLTSGNSWATKGKIGAKSLTLTELQPIVLNYYSSPMAGAKQMSYAFWVKVNTAWETQWLDGIRWYSTDGTTEQYSRQEFYTNCTYVGTWYKGGSISGKSFTPGQWTHVAATFDYETGKVNFYLNGILQGSATNLDTTHYCRGDFYIGDSGTDMCENDVRIYDHCLSAAEVHEIAQGLVLHYKLEGPMGGSGINLLQGANKIGDSNSYGWIKNGSYTNFSIEKLEGNVIHYKGTISNNKYIPSITTNTVAPCEFGKTYTYQMELKFDKDVKLASNIPMHYWAGCRNTDDITNVSCNGNLTGITYSYVQNHSGTLAANTWVKIITQITFPSAATSTGYNYPAIRAFVYGGVLPEAYTGEVNVWMRNCKIEEGTAATNWSPASEDLGIDTTIVEDSSGYGHNGEIINNITLQADSPRYSSSTHFSATNQKIKISNFPTSGFGDSYTFAWWGKVSSTSPMQWGFKDGIRLNGMYQGKLWNTGDSSNNPLYIPGTTTQVTAPTTGVWHHYVMTGDGNTCKVYLDGALWGQAKTYKSISGTTIYINGWDNTTTYASSNFSISDFRIYCTPLLDKDIKLLYNTSMRIDNLGGVHSFEFEEFSLEQPKLLQTGILKNKNFFEQEFLFNETSGWSYNPTGANNSTASSVEIDVSKFYKCGKSVQFHLEYDLSWTNITPNNNGTFSARTQGNNFVVSADAFQWSGTNYFTDNSHGGFNTTQLMTANSTGSTHISKTITIPASWFETYSKSRFSFRTDYATGTITLSNLKITLVKGNAKLNSQYLSASNIIEI